MKGSLSYVRNLKKVKKKEEEDGEEEETKKKKSLDNGRRFRR